MLYKPATSVNADVRQRLDAELRRRWPFHLAVTLPIVIATLYLYGFAANQYISAAQFVVRNPETAARPSLLGDVLGAVGEHSTEETFAVKAYLESQDAVAALSHRVDLGEIYRRPSFDLLNRLRPHPTAEDLLSYYRGKVRVDINPNTGISTLTVRSFRPEDSQVIALDLLQLGETAVNRLNEAARSDTVALAEAEVERARQRTLGLSDELLHYRNQKQVLDPAASSETLQKLVGGLEDELAKARVERDAAAKYLRPGAPKLTEFDNQIAALTAQLADQRARMTGGSAALSSAAPAYEHLMLEREFAGKDYAAALSALELARIDAAKKHLYLVRIVDPNRAERSLAPQRGLILLSLLIALLVGYGIGWLIIAGVREHAA